MRKARNRTERGFTLVELVVVVVLVAVITAAIFPLALAKLGQRPRVEAPASSVEVAPPAASLLSSTGALVGPATIASAIVNVDLGASPVIEGVRTSTRYEARFHGTFVVDNDAKDAEAIALQIPFPANIAEARDVALVIVDGATVREARGAVYGTSGVSWRGPLAPGASLTFAISYVARGQGAFAFDLPDGGRTGNVRVEVDYRGVDQAVIPAASLEPTEQSRGRVIFALDHVVTKKGIVVELPPGPSPLGRVMLLCQLAGLAVLLFGAGFWYLSEGDRPGRLDTFRWAHFFLLALNHVAFFAIFAALAIDGAVVVPLVSATLVSQSLLALHASRIVTPSFAVRRVLPLSLLSLVIVVAGVYLPSDRAIIATIAGVAVVAYVTVSYRRWSLGRELHRKANEEKKREELDASDLEAQREAERRPLDEAIAHASRLRAEGFDARMEAEDALRGASDEHALTAEHLKAATEQLASALEEPDVELRDAEALDDRARGIVLRRLEVAARRSNERVAERTEIVRAATRALVDLQQRSDLRARARAEIAELSHCIGCGERGDPSCAHCPSCGLARPIRLPCDRCSHAAELPRHLLRRSALRAPLHCVACGNVLAIPA